MVFLALLTLLLPSCWPEEPITPQQQDAYDKCLEKADNEMDAEADKLCINKGFAWDKCPDKPAIMAKLTEKQQRCRP